LITIVFKQFEIFVCAHSNMVKKCVWSRMQYYRGWWE
jgi:hypothetical protein